MTLTLDGNMMDNTTWCAALSVKTLTPSDDDIRDNPLGIYITAFDMKRIDTTINEKLGRG